LDELRKFSPAIYQASLASYEKMDHGFLPEEESLKIPSVSIDYAVMEKSDKIRVVPSYFNWSDMVSFEAIYDYIKEKEADNRSSYLVLGSKKYFDLIGVENMILVESEDAILVLNKNKAQDFKKVYER